MVSEMSAPPFIVVGIAEPPLGGQNGYGCGGNLK